jgi:GNAT superfamily N-acetyltransferase
MSKAAGAPPSEQPFQIVEVSGEHPLTAASINAFNSSFPDDFLPLKPHHLTRGHWWLVHSGPTVIGFAGMVPFEPFPRVGYLKRAAVLPAWRGKGIQRQLFSLREEKARTSTDWTHIVSECSLENVASGNNFIRSGYLLVSAERPWEKETLFWRKTL